MIIGLDPSLTHYGWVLFDENKIGSESIYKYGVYKTDTSDGRLIQRLITQRKRIKSLLEIYEIKFVSMEAPIWGSYSTELLFALNQFIHEVFLDLGIFVIYLQPTVIKKWAIPNLKSGEVQKHHITHQAKIELGLMGKRFSEHVADAYFAGKIGLKFYRWYFLHSLKDEDLTEYEHDVFCGKHTFTRGEKKGLTEYTGIIYRENDQFFDYSKQKRNTNTVTEELLNGVK